MAALAQKTIDEHKLSHVIKVVNARSDDLDTEIHVNMQLWKLDCEWGQWTGKAV